MTISYTAQVATSSFSCFLKLLARWRGSIYKLLWRDFALFATIYFLLQFLYRFVLNADQRKIFELISHYCESNNALIPVAFVLGFYVSIIMSRWWSALNMIPWPDHMAMYVTANVHDLGRSDEEGRLLRRTMLRYFNLAYVITMTCISTQVKKRFPTYQHMITAGLLTAEENSILEKLSKKNQQYFIPLAWTTNLVSLARAENRIKDDYAQKTLIDEINEFRRCLATLCVYDLVTVPLVYTQVVTIAVYMFFLSCLMGRQFLMDDPSSPDLFFPVFTFLEYFFYMGWLKVAECLINPFGDDEDDFPMNELIDRNLQVAYLLVDEVRVEFPQLQRDHFWNDADCQMPYTYASAPFRSAQQLFKGSTMDVRIPVEDKDYRAPSPIDEGEDETSDVEEEGVPPSSSGRAGGSMFINRQLSNESFYSKTGLPFFSRSSTRSISGVRPRQHKKSETESIVAGSAGAKGNTSLSSSPAPNNPERDHEIFELELLDHSEHEALLRPNNVESLEMKHLMVAHPKSSTKKTPSVDTSKDTSQQPHVHLVGSGSSTAINLTNLYTVPEVTAREEKSESVSSLLEQETTSATIPSIVLQQLSPGNIPTTGRLLLNQAPADSIIITPVLHSEDIAAQATPTTRTDDGRKFRWSENYNSPGNLHHFPSPNAESPKSPSLLSPQPSSPVWISQGFVNENNGTDQAIADSEV